jgi:glycerate kinase
MLIAGRIADEQQLLDAGFAHATCINPPGLPLEIAIQPETAKENIELTIAKLSVSLTKSCGVAVLR